MLPLLLALLALTSPPADDPTTALLRAKDQALLDAIAPGDRKLWDAALAPDAIYVDENGVIMDRAEFLKGLDPLPAGSSGVLKIIAYQAHISGDLATVIHTDDEIENYHGQTLHAQYLMTETWRRDSGEWKLLLAHSYAILMDPPSITLPESALQEYTGRYSGGSDLVFLIQWDGKQLVCGREGRALKPLLPEVKDVFFVPGDPRIRKIFQRDAAGHVTGFVERRETWDVVWRREPAAPSSSGKTNRP